MLDAALLTRKLSSQFWIFFTFFSVVIPFYVRSGSCMHSGSDSAKAKSSGSGSSSTTLRTSFHYLLTGTCGAVLHSPLRASQETLCCTGTHLISLSDIFISTL
jgi:hypothetical protein